MKKLSVSCLVALTGLAFTVRADPAPRIVGYFTKEAPTVFETKIKPFFTEQTRKSCPQCQIRNLTPYSKSGTYDPAALPAAVEAVGSDVTFLFFDWNERANEGNQKIRDALSGKMTEGHLVVASAGVPPTNEGTCPLVNTLMGKIPNVLILGELEEKDRLSAQCYYGPEMLSAIRPPKEWIGRGFGPLYFVTRLATHWERRGPAEWGPYLKARKAKTNRIWTGIEEFFPR
ncbi:MAG TPA: hypothetical protein PL182_03005 [Pseudobdellovibrionaceae bacterium]|nr:hypothetical protein [Pseudobdellovibrionaceae bacterium]